MKRLDKELDLLALAFEKYSIKNFGIKKKLNDHIEFVFFLIKSGEFSKTLLDQLVSLINL